jgi:hypothetical protein
MSRGKWLRVWMMVKMGSSDPSTIRGLRIPGHSISRDNILVETCIQYCISRDGPITIANLVAAQITIRIRCWTRTHALIICTISLRLCFSRCFSIHPFPTCHIKHKAKCHLVRGEGIFLSCVVKKRCETLMPPKPSNGEYVSIDGHTSAGGRFVRIKFISMQMLFAITA